MKRTVRLGMCSIALVLLSSTGALLTAQYVDTVQVEGGEYRYKVFKKNANGEVEGSVLHFDADSVLRAKTQFKDGKAHGTAIYYYPNGRIWAEMPYRNGELNGIIKTYHRNGAVEAVKPYRNGKLHGERMLRDSTGALVNGEYVEELPYDSGRVYSTCVNGRPHGTVTVTIRGRRSLEGNCQNGLAEGAFYMYDENGKAIRRDFYEKGEFVSSIHLR